MHKDYSVFSEPIDATIINSDSSQEFSLSAAQIADFQTEGFVVGQASISEDYIARLLHDLTDLLTPDHVGKELWHEYHINESTDPDTVLFHALGAWRLRQSFHDLLWHPAITTPAKQLLNASVRFWHDQLFCKPARHGGVVAWHQDYSYWTRSGPMNHLTCWIALENATIENGCIHYIKGSHRWELLPITGLAGGMDSIRNVLSEDQASAFETPVPIELKAGQIVFHHPLTVHGSFENRTSRSRKATVVNLISDGVTSQTNEPLLSGVPVIPKGEPIQGQFFPLLKG